MEMTRQASTNAKQSDADSIGTPKLAGSSLGIVLIYALIGGELLAAGRTDYNDLHTVLDASAFLLSGLLAWLFWDLGKRINQIFPRWLAVTFGGVSVLSAIHVLVVVEWSGALAPIEQAAGELRPASWLPAVYLLPIGLAWGLLLIRRRSQSLAASAVALIASGAGLLLVSEQLHEYSAPMWLDITRPALVFVPFLWFAVGSVCWWFRAADRVMAALTLMAAVLITGHVAMLYSRTPDDGLAMVAHLGTVCGYLILLLTLVHMASSETLARLRSEQTLVRLNHEKDRIAEDLRHAAKRADEANAAKSQFLAAMSHEIRTPMNGVIGVVELLQLSPLSTNQKKMVEIIRQSGVGLLDVINDILDYSKIEAGRMTVEHVKFALGEVIETTTAAIGGHTKSKTLNVVCTVDPTIDWFMEGDPLRVRQIILNLMGNALKFTEVGFIGIAATAESITDDQIVVLFEVTDTGIGIEEEKQKILFQPFSQADYSTTRKYGGTGLGLSIARTLVKLMSGEIGCRSTPGEGSTFWFRIPFSRLPEGQRENPFMTDKKALAGLRALVCDRTVMRPWLSRYLSAVGIEVAESRNVAESIDILSDHYAAGRPVDLAIIKSPVGDDSASLFVAAISTRKDLKDINILFVRPQSDRSEVRATTGRSTTIMSPVQRAGFYEAVAYVAGRAVVRKDAPSSGDDLTFSGPTVEEAAVTGCLILIAEDNATNKFVIESQMRQLGYATELVSDGREAWNVLQRDESRYGLLITDCHMPYLDGYQLTGRIRDRELVSKNRLPIVALTANALEGESDTCLAAGMDDYISKPAKLKALDAVVRKWLPRAATLRKPMADAPGITRGGENRGSPATTPRVDNAVALPINMRALAEILGSDDPKYLQSTLAVFWKTVEGTSGELQQLIQARDDKKLRKVLHGTMGAAAAAGAEGLGNLIKELDTHARTQNWSEADALSSRISSVFKDLHDFIEVSQQVGSAHSHASDRKGSI
jgi:signal transduction histidine kinase/CheY-like chemotaxis protein